MMLLPPLAFLMALNLIQTKHFLVETENKKEGHQVDAVGHVLPNEAKEEYKSPHRSKPRKNTKVLPKVLPKEVRRWYNSLNETAQKRWYNRWYNKWYNSLNETAQKSLQMNGWEILLFWNTSIRIYGNVFLLVFSHLSFKTAIKKSFNKNHKTLSIRREGHKIPGFFLMVSLSFAFHPFNQFCFD